MIRTPLLVAALVGSLLGSAPPATAAPVAVAAPAGAGSMRPADTARMASGARYPVTAPTVWLCRPGMPDNPCERDLGVTVVGADGSTTRTTYAPNRSARFDCFYVYPTVSQAAGRNAPKRVTPELVYVVRAQAVPFQRQCRLFAPVYRQVTLAGLVSGGFTDPVARAKARVDVVNAFHDYLNRYNKGRPFLLLGHSQGAMVLTELIQREIDGDASLRRRMVSAMLLGSGVWLAPGSARQGTFQNVPPCRRAGQARCVVAYGSYAGTPPADGLFGRNADGRRAVCVNPAAPAGGAARVTPVVPVPSAPGVQDVAGYLQFTDGARARCRSNAAHTWLDVSAVPGSALPPAILEPGGAWGLHRYDVTLALGDLVDLARRQARTLTRR